MAYFFAVCTDKPDSGALRAATRPTHLDFLAAQGDAVRVGGPFLNDAGDPVGSLLIIEAADRAAAEALLARDPYAVAGLFASVEVRPWRWTVGAPAA